MKYKTIRKEINLEKFMQDNSLDIKDVADILEMTPQGVYSILKKGTMKFSSWKKLAIYINNIN